MSVDWREERGARAVGQQRAARQHGLRGEPSDERLLLFDVLGAWCTFQRFGIGPAVLPMGRSTKGVPLNGVKFLKRAPGSAEASLEEASGLSELGLPPPMRSRAARPTRRTRQSPHCAPYAARRTRRRRPSRCRPRRRLEISVGESSRETEVVCE